ncbi:hypothetical protein OAG24_00325 [bacterium]|nr:hypothetical protein [bacterium]
MCEAITKMLIRICRFFQKESTFKLYLTTVVVLPLIITYFYFGISLALEEGEYQNKFCYTTKKIMLDCLCLHMASLLFLFLFSFLNRRYKSGKEKIILNFLCMLLGGISGGNIISVVYIQLLYYCNDPEFTGQNTFIVFIALVSGLFTYCFSRLVSWQN